MHDVFISYSSKDQYVADAIVNNLENRRIKCWIAYRDAHAGDNYAASIVRAIKNSKICILIFSKESNQSKHVINEINVCVNNGTIIIPFRIADTSMDDALEYYLGKTHWLDALTDPLESHINKLADRIKNLINNESVEHDKVKIINTDEEPQPAINTPPSTVKNAKPSKPYIYALPRGKSIEGLEDTIHSFLQMTKNMDTQIIREPNSIFIQARVKGGKWKQFIGMDKVLTIRINKVDNEKVSVSIGEAKWADKISVMAVSLLVFWPLALTSGAGMIMQGKLPGEINKVIKNYLSQ